MTRLLALLALLPLLALVAAVVMVSRTCPTQAGVNQTTSSAVVDALAQPQAAPTATPDANDPSAISDTIALADETKTQAGDLPAITSPSTTSSTSTTSSSPSPVADIASTLITPPTPPAPTSAVAKPVDEQAQKLELLQLEVSLLRDTNRDLLKAIDALKLQLASAQAEIINLQAMLPLEDWPLDAMTPSPASPAPLNP